MNKSKKVGIRFLAVCAVVLAAAAVLLTVSALMGEDFDGDGKITPADAAAYLFALVSGGSVSDVNADGTADIKDVNRILQQANAAGPRLTALSLDDGTNLSFAADKFIYNVTLPAGRPRIPQASASAASGDTVKIYQATMADGVSEGMAKIEVTNASGDMTIYEIRFTKDASAGFHLMYDDRYTFVPDYSLSAAETFSFTSSAPSVASVDANGEITALALSSSPVTISALVGGQVKDTLVINKIVKAQINIFLITGQSNAAGSSDSGVDAALGYSQGYRTKPGTAYCMEVSRAGDISAAYDMRNSRVNPSSTGVPGFAPALAKTWYDLSGEKVYCIHSAVGGAPIEVWSKGGDYYGSGAKNFYDNTLAAYRKTMSNWAKSGNFELLRVHYYWCQGETGMRQIFDPSIHNWRAPDASLGEHILYTDEYYDLFMSNHAHFLEDMDVDICGIMLVRATAGVSSAQSTALQLLTDLVPARAAQYALNNSNGDDVVIASRICDIARMESWLDRTVVGWGYMGPANLHYLQPGYNAQGVELAKNTFAMVDAYCDRSPVELEVLDSDGRTRLADGDTITIDVAAETKHQIAAIVLPLYTDKPHITYTVTSGESFCSIDEYGMITVSPDAKGGSVATVSIRNESGLEKTLRVKIAGSTISPVQYRWDFDDLNEANGLNNLSDGVYSSKAYTISDGTYSSSSNTTDLALERPIWLSSNYDWSIEWKAKFTGGSALFGTSAATTNFIYVAYGVATWNNPFRVVPDSGGFALMIPYGSYVGYNTSGMNTWKAEWTAADDTLTLYFLNGSTWEKVGSTVETREYQLTLTHMFGRYTVDSTNVDLRGTVDYIDVKTVEKSE